MTRMLSILSISFWIFACGGTDPDDNGSAAGDAGPADSAARLDGGSGSEPDLACEFDCSTCGDQIAECEAENVSCGNAPSILQDRCCLIHANKWSMLCDG